MASAISNKERSLIDAYWRAANYLSVGEIYLYDNPLLKHSPGRQRSEAFGRRPPTAARGESSRCVTR